MTAAELRDALRAYGVTMLCMSECESMVFVTARRPGYVDLSAFDTDLEQAVQKLLTALALTTNHNAQA